MIANLLWRVVALIVTIPAVTEWLIARAQRTPYVHIESRDGTERYMGRWWLFNAYGKNANGDTTPPRWEWLPSIRVHHICRADDDNHLHDHPWNARTIVLKNGYSEERIAEGYLPARGFARCKIGPDGSLLDVYTRRRGYTGRLLFGEYHRICHIPPGGAWTLFFTWRYQGTWGFLVNETKVPYKVYLKAKHAAA